MTDASDLDPADHASPQRSSRKGVAFRVANAVMESRRRDGVRAQVDPAVARGSENERRRAAARPSLRAIGAFLATFLLLMWAIPAPQPSLSAVVSANRSKEPGQPRQPREVSREDPMKNPVFKTFAASAAMAVASAASADNHVLKFSSGQTGAMNVAHAAIQNAPAQAGEMTIEFWILTEALVPCCDSDPQGRPVSKRACSASGYTIQARIGLMGSELGGVADTRAPFPTEGWHHFAVTWSASERLVRSYADGVLVHTESDAGTDLQQLSTDLRFGEQCGRGMIGALDNVRIWSRVRTAQEIANDMSVQYTESQAGEAVGLVGSWTFEGKNPLADGTAQNADGVLEAGASIVVDDVFPSPCPGDVDDSGFADAIDLAIVLANWGTPSPKYPASDINSDGIVNGADLATVLSSWGACP
jgi:hypothetical protein